MKMSEITSLVDQFLAKGLAIKRIASDHADNIDIEFYEPKQKSEPMALDPLSLAKAFADQMPPDSAMMFAATEEMPGVDVPVIPGQPLDPSEP